jgi:hypothetical protein
MLKRNSRINSIILKFPYLNLNIWLDEGDNKILFDKVVLLAFLHLRICKFYWWRSRDTPPLPFTSGARLVACHLNAINLLSETPLMRFFLLVLGFPQVQNIPK